MEKHNWVWKWETGSGLVVFCHNWTWWLFSHQLASGPDPSCQNLTKPCRLDLGLFWMIRSGPSLEEWNQIRYRKSDLARFWLHTGSNDHNWPLPKCLWLRPGVFAGLVFPGLRSYLKCSVLAKVLKIPMELTFLLYWSSHYCFPFFCFKFHYIGTLQPKLQALVYGILLSTTAIFSYVIGSRKLSANEQFFVGAQTVVSLLQTTQIKQGVSFIATSKVYSSTNKTTIVWIETELFSLPGVDASHVYMHPLALGCFYRHISTGTFRRALTTSLDCCVEIKSTPSVA